MARHAVHTSYLERTGRAAEEKGGLQASPILATGGCKG